MKNEDKILAMWKDYFQNLHTGNANDEESSDYLNDHINDDVNPTIEGLDETDTNIKMIEFINAKTKRKIKVGKTPGTDELYLEIVVNQGIAIHKSGATTLRENYRGISLLSVPGNVYMLGS